MAVLRFIGSCLIASIPMLGCDIPDRPPLGPVKPLASPEGEPAVTEGADDVVEAPGELFSGDWESWDAFYIRDRHVGYMHVAAEAQPPKRESVQYRVDHRLLMRRGRSALVQQFSYVSNESVAGELIGFEASLHVGPAVTRFQGVIDETQLSVRRVRGSETEETDIPWRTTYRGLVGVEQSFRRKPMTAGQTRTLKMPMMLQAQYVMATVRLTAGELASVPMLDGQQTLLEIESEVEVGDSVIKSVIWADDKGQIRRTYAPAIHMFTYRTDRATAIADMDSIRSAPKSVAFDVTGKLPKPSERTRVAYRISPSRAVSIASGSISVDPAPGQYVRALDDGTYQVLVSRKAETVAKGFVASDLKPGPEDRTPNAWIDSGSPLIRRYVELALPGNAYPDPREAAIQLAETAHSIVPETTKQFPGFSLASKIDQRGDSTQQAMLLTALLRARGIPARLASGLRFVPGESPRMDYHTWTLAFVEGKWLPLDATTGTIAPPDRIILGMTTLSSGTEYESIDAVTGAVGRMEIEIVGSR